MELVRRATEHGCYGAADYGGRSRSIGYACKIKYIARAMAPGVLVRRARESIKLPGSIVTDVIWAKAGS